MVACTYHCPIKHRHRAVQSYVLHMHNLLLIIMSPCLDHIDNKLPSSFFKSCFHSSNVVTQDGKYQTVDPVPLESTQVWSVLFHQNIVFKKRISSCGLYTSKNRVLVTASKVYSRPVNYHFVNWCLPGCRSRWIWVVAYISEWVPLNP